MPPAPDGAIDVPSLTESAELAAISAEQTELLTMQKAVFDDLAWQFEAFLVGGMAALDLAHANKELDDVTFAAWQEIDQGTQFGDQADIESGNQTILKREQRNVLQPLYDKFRVAGVGNIAGPTATSMVTNPIPGGAQFTGTDITNFDHRWDWVDSQVRQAFLNLTSAQRNQDVGRSFGQEITFNRNQPKGKNIP
jgi:hypothetical protein